MLNCSLFYVIYLKGNLKYFSPPRNFENSALTPIELLFGLALDLSLKICNAQLTPVLAAKDVTE